MENTFTAKMFYYNNLAKGEKGVEKGVENDKLSALYREEAEKLLKVYTNLYKRWQQSKKK